MHASCPFFVLFLVVFTCLNCFSESTTDYTDTWSPTPSVSSCSEVVFIGEFSRAIGQQAKSDFFDVVYRLVDVLPNTTRFSFSQFGTKLYSPIQLQGYEEFLATLDDMYGAFNATNDPNGSLVYLEPILSDLEYNLQTGQISHSIVLMMAEMEWVRDPSTSASTASQISAFGANIYVIDYTVNMPYTIFPDLTSGRPNHIFNGTIHDSTAIYNWLANTLIPDLENGNC